MGTVVSFRPENRRPWPPITLRVGIDFNRWCVSHYRGDKLLKRESFDGEAEARVAANALARAGRYAIGPDLPPCVTYQSWVDDGDDCA